jgi:predicted metal-dependent phosphoesterase TrpH
VGLDLHTHSVYSDGSHQPEEIIDIAINLNLTAVAITDHDNVLAYEIAKGHAIKRAEEDGVKLMEIVPGIEVNTIHDGKEVHILGYYFDASRREMQDMIKYQQHARIQQTVEIIKKLKKEARIDIKLEDITSLVKEGGSVGRPHIAKAIVKSGGVSSMIEAYKKYISDTAPTYIKRKTVSPFEAVETIYESGGIPVVAHPCDIENAESLISELMSYGLRGVEVYHRKHSPAMIEYFSHIAEKYELIVTGGSDCHGPKANGQIMLGRTHVPDRILAEMKKEKNRLEIASR